jgi:hypothetical protein
LSAILPIAYLSAFVLFIGSILFNRRLDGFRFDLSTAKKDRREKAFFVVGLAFYLAILLHGVLVDTNYTIQEFANLQEADFDPSDIRAFLFGGNLFGHQHLYHLLVSLVVRLLSLEGHEQILIAARSLSALFAAGTLLIFRGFVRSVRLLTTAAATCFVFGLMPLNFFYSIQAEPYAMFLFMSVLNLRLFFRLGHGSGKRAVLGFSVISILGYLTHYYFLLLLAAEALFVIYLWLFRKKNYFYFELALVFVLPVLLLTHRSVLVMLTSPFIEYQQGYFEADPGFVLTQLYAIWGLLPVVFGAGVLKTGIVYLALLALLVGRTVQNRRDEPTVFFAILLLLQLLAFAAFNTVTALRGYGTITLRHYIATSIPLVLLYFYRGRERKAKTHPYLELVSKPPIVNILWIAALGVFIFSDISFLTRPYRFDGRSLATYLVKMRNRDKVRHISVASWLESCGMRPWLEASGVGSIKGDYYLTDIVDLINNDSWPTKYRAKSEGDELRMKGLLAELENDGYGIVFDRGKPPAENLNDFMASPGIRDAALKRIKSRGIRIPEEVFRIASTERSDPGERREIDFLTTRLYIELLYPAFRMEENMLDVFVQEKRIKKIVRGKRPGEVFLLLIIREQILGMEYFDPKEQYQALATVRKIPGVEELFLDRLDNVEIYGFRKTR